MGFVVLPGPALREADLLVLGGQRDGGVVHQHGVVSLPDGHHNPSGERRTGVALNISLFFFLASLFFCLSSFSSYVHFSLSLSFFCLLLFACFVKQNTRERLACDQNGERDLGCEL